MWIKENWTKRDELKCQVVIHTALKAKNTSKWYFDSECSRHMTGDKSLFNQLKETQDGSAAFGDGNLGKIIGK